MGQLWGTSGFHVGPSGPSGYNLGRPSGALLYNPGADCWAPHGAYLGPIWAKWAKWARDGLAHLGQVGQPSCNQIKPRWAPQHFAIWENAKLVTHMNLKRIFELIWWAWFGYFCILGHCFESKNCICMAYQGGETLTHMPCLYHQNRFNLCRFCAAQALKPLPINTGHLGAFFSKKSHISHFMECFANFEKKQINL